MRTPPPDLADRDVGAVVAHGWSVAAATIEYAPLGFGSHHWLLTEASGQRWFVTADAVAQSPERLAAVTAALTTAHGLRHRCGLEFVAAPVIGRADELLGRTGRYAVALYPYLDRITEAPAEPQHIVDMVAALHAATAGVRHLATVDDLTLPDRSTLEAALDDAAAVPDAGPHAADFAALVREHRPALLAALARHDADAHALQAGRDDWVVTHGEPKPNNTMVTATGPVLVDWDTVQIAPPARDVWMLGSVDDYLARTGRDVPAEELGFCRRRWDLKDLCGSAAWFAQPHERTTDTELAWQGSIKICRRLAAAARDAGRGAQRA